MTTEDTGLQEMVAHDFLALADLLEAATPAQWDTPSMCEGWRVREVVAHMTMPARYSDDQFAAELEACGFDFSTLSNKVAGRDGQLPAAELVAGLRADVMHRWTPPGGGRHAALSHVVIHGLDVTVPLGVSRRSSDDTMRVILDGLTVGGAHQYFGIDIDGRRLCATDLDWSHGSGSELRGATEDLVLAMTGRRLPSGRLEGAPLS